MGTAVRYYHGLSREQSLNQIRELLKSGMKHYRDVRVRCSATVEADEVKSALCIIHVIPHGTPVQRQPSRTYGNIRLIEHWLPIDRLVQFLEGASAQPSAIDGCNVAFEKDLHFQSAEFHSSLNDYSDHPGTLYIARGSHRPTVEHSALCSYDQPYQPSGFQAIFDWSEIRNFNGGSDARVGSTMLFLPECRARFEEISYSEGLLVVKPHVVEEAPMKVKGAWKKAGELIPFDYPVTDSRIAIQLGEIPDEIDICLVGEGNTLYDFHKEERSWSVSRRRIFASKAADLVPPAILDAIRQGETENVEFKEFIEPGTTRQQQIIEAIVAFANTRGGIILIGVDNHCSIIGMEKDLGSSGIRVG